MQQLAHCEDHGDRLIVVNSNPSKRNALSPDLYRVLVDSLDLAAREPRITSVILRGEGGYFCAGGDLGLLATRRDLPRDQRLARIGIEQTYHLIMQNRDVRGVVRHPGTIRRPPATPRPLDSPPWRTGSF